MAAAGSEGEQAMASSHSGAAQGVWTRRGFVGALTALAAAGLSGCSGAPVAGSSSWRAGYDGRSVARGEPDYERWRTAMPWQMYKAPRYPDLIVRPDSASAVAEAVARARAAGQRVAIKSGGHNVSEAFLRDGGMLLDLGELQGIDVDPGSATAWVEPALWSHGLVRALEPHAFAFPVAHCATVPMGGFLLGGGLGYNHDNWGTLACHAILAAEVVLADGDTCTVTPDRHPDLYWAVRGAGMGFPGVVTRYRLQLYPAPGAVYESSYIFPLAQLQQATAMLQDWAAANPADTELMMLLAHNPMAPPDAPPLMRKMCIVRAVAYAATATAARRELTALGAHPAAAAAIARNELQATSLEQMAVDSVNAEMGLGFGRYAVDTIWTDRLPEVMTAVRDHFLQANSVKTHFVVSPKVNRQLPADAAFSMVGETFVGAYTMWDEAADDAAAFAWLAGTSRRMRPLAVGQYINEVDAFRDPAAVRRCFSAGSWQRLSGVRERYDRTGLFFGWPGERGAGIG
jgi:FAD/FMN-containing dehydrogenase